MAPSPRLLIVCGLLFTLSAIISITLKNTPSGSGLPFFHQPARVGHATNLYGTSSDADPYKDVAFATFLAAPENEAPKVDSAGMSVSELQAAWDEHDARDGYYLGARVLAYSLLHARRSATNRSIPFVVVCTPEVTERKRARLAADGATVVVMEKLEHPNWLTPGSSRWKDVMAKLRLFELTQYRKICFIDADHLVTARLDGVFDDPATSVQRNREKEEMVKDDEGAMPPTYMFAGKSDVFGYDHELPPKETDYLNAGFFVFRPSKELFGYYESLLKLEGRFGQQFPEQNLMNYAHRLEGNIPWQRLNWRWNANWPTVKDMDAGARSFHAKYWDSDQGHDQTLKNIWTSLRWEMEGFYRGVEFGKGL